MHDRQPSSSKQRNHAESLDDIATAHSIHEVAINILPEEETSEKDDSDVLGRKPIRSRSSSLRSLVSFKRESIDKSKTLSSKHMFHNERDEMRLIAQMLDCLVPNPQLLSLQDDEIFSLDDRVKLLELQEAKQMQLHDNKTLLSEARSLVVRASPGGANDGGTSEGRGGGFAPYLWTDAQEAQRHKGLQEFVPYIPGQLLRPRLRTMQEFESHEKITSWREFTSGENAGEKSGLANIKTFVHFQNMALDGLSPNERLDVGKSTRLGSMVSQFLNLEVVIMKGAGITTLDGWILPKLLYCDLSQNNIATTIPLVVLAEHSFHLQVLELRENPLTSSLTWPADSPHPGIDMRGACNREWNILIEFPDLVVLNGKHVSLEHHEHVCSAFGNEARQKRVGLRRWDQMVSEAAPELVSGVSKDDQSQTVGDGSKKTWRPLAVTHLAIPNVGLTEFHVGCFRSLLTLDLSKNRIHTLSGAGLEACEFLWALNLSDNAISRTEELNVFTRMPSLRCLFLQGNPLPEGYKEIIIIATMHLPGSDHTPGLLELNGEGISIDERVIAAFHPVYSSVRLNDGAAAAVETRSWFCCFKSNSTRASTDASVTRGSDNIEVPKNQQFRFELELDNFFGRGYLASLPSLSSLVYLRLEGRDLRVIDLRPFTGLETLDLQNNPIERLLGLDKLTNLHVLDLRGHPVADAETRIQQWLSVAESLINLHAIAVLARPLINAEAKAFQLRVLKTLHLKTHKFLGIVEDSVVTIEVRAELMKSERGADGKPTDLEMDQYKAQLAVLTCTHHAVGRSYSFEDVTKNLQVDVTAVRELERLGGLGLHDAVLDFAKYTKLRVLNLSGNEIVNIMSIGLECLKELRVLDLSFNHISMKPK